jgi:hypothetical protein
VFFKGLLRGKGTGAVLFAAATQASATERVITTVSLLFMPFALKAERYTSVVSADDISEG